MSADFCWLAFEPLDTWFFRDGAPYTHRGMKTVGTTNGGNVSDDQAGIESIFPPPASTLIGALRAAWAREKGWNGIGNWKAHLNLVLGDGPDDLADLSFRGPFLQHNAETLFPLPLHLLGTFPEGKFTPATFLLPGDPLHTDAGKIQLPQLEGPGKGLKTGESLYVTTQGMQQILDGTIPNASSIRRPQDLWRFEHRVALQRDPSSHAVGEESLYSPGYVRLTQGTKLIFGYAGLPDKTWTTPNLLPLGGESRCASVESIQAPALPRAKPIQHPLLVLTTPTPWPLSSDFQSLLALWGLTLVSACVGKPLLVGGWNSLTKKPLPLRPYLPPGTLFFCHGEAPSQPFTLCPGNPHGYGEALLGTW